MEYTLEVDFAPIYECVNSMTVFMAKQNHNALDAGKLWVREVQDRFAPVTLQKMRNNIKAANDYSLSPCIWRCPVERTVSGFLDWFEDLSAGQLYEIYAECGQTIPANLPELRGLVSEVLREWDAHYFSSVNPAILEGLQREADTRRLQIQPGHVMELYEEVTGGMRLYPNDKLKHVIITPQYHARPLVTSSFFDEIAFTSYSADVIAPEPGRPAPGLLRLTRALSDETRLCILRLLAQEQLTFTDIVRSIGLSKSTIHYHLIALRSAGLVIVHYNSRSMDSRIIEYSLRLEALQGLPGQMGDFLQS